MQVAAIRESDVRHVPTGADPQPLAEALELFRSFDAAGVRYCHFKSNEHLLDGLAGLTDLDVLVDPGCARAAQRSLLERGFKRFEAGFAGAYPGVEDYLGCDPRSGSLLHLHLHYALAVGEKHLKGYRLRSAVNVLDARVRDAQTGTFTSDPEHELQLLLLRFALKLRWRDHVLERLGVPFFRGAALREYRWLASRVDRARLREITRDELGAAAADVVVVLLETPPSAARLRALRRSARDVLRGSRSYGPIEGRLLRVARELAASSAAATRRWLGVSWPLRRTNPTGGRVVAFLGPDGCGKSTLARELCLWLSWKLDVRVVYFGSGDGPATLPRWVAQRTLAAARAVVRSFGAERSAPPAPAPSGLDGTGSASVSRAVWATVLALEKRSKMREVVRARDRGLVVLCDRHPQVNVSGFNDGPLLTPWLASGSSWRRRWAAWEGRVYARAAASGPDLALKLDVAPEVAVRRKPGTLAEAERRRTALHRIDFGSACRHVVIDAGRPLDEVLLDAKRAIWERL